MYIFSDDDDYEKNAALVSQSSSSSSSDGGESEDSSPRPYRAAITKRKPKQIYGRHWSGEMSARSNQDNQREFEERAMKQIIAMVGKKTGSDANLKYQTYQQGVTYIKLEAEWRESIKQKAASKVKNNSTK